MMGHPRSATSLRAGLLAVGLALGCTAPPDQFVPVPDPVSVRVGEIERLPLFKSLSPAPATNGKRVERLVTLFEQAGCSESLVTQLPGGSPVPNVICVLQGTTPWSIVVGADINKAGDGTGTADNWSSIALLPTLYEALRSDRRHHTFVFAGFGHADLRQAGSRGFLRRMEDEDRERIVGMVNVKGIGLSTTAMWAGQADRNLRQDLYAVTRTLDLPLREVRFYRSVNADSKAFRQWGIPAITIHSFDSKNARILAQPQYDGGPVNIDVDSYYDTARTLAFFLAYLDDTMRIRRERAISPDA